MVFDVEPSDRISKTAERASTVNRVQQFVTPTRAGLTAREALHHRPFMNFELVWQYYEIARFQGIARLEQTLVLPLR